MLNNFTRIPVFKASNDARPAPDSVCERIMKGNPVWGLKADEDRQMRIPPAVAFMRHAIDNVYICELDVFELEDVIKVAVMPLQVIHQNRLALIVTSQISQISVDDAVDLTRQMRR